MPGSALMRAASALAIASTTSFSRVPRLPDAPGSTPPWPASTAITMSRPESLGACAGRMATGAAGAAGVTATIFGDAVRGADPAMSSTRR